MGKYEPLSEFLVTHPGDKIPMTFKEIEAILGAPLPKSKQYAAWWSNNPSNNTMTQVWLDAGFTTEQVDTVGEKLVFRRNRPGRRFENTPPQAPARRGTIARLQAKLAGTVTFAPGFDPTEPTGEIWDAER